MPRSCFQALVPLLVATSLRAQTPADSGEPLRVGPGVTAPRLIHKIEPEYSSEALADHIQGTVILQIVVNEKGRASDISVISPLGFGLDEQAVSAVEKWEFVPGMNAGVPVKILATGTMTVTITLKGDTYHVRARKSTPLTDEDYLQLQILEYQLRYYGLQPRGAAAGSG